MQHDVVDLVGVHYITISVVRIGDLERVGMLLCSGSVLLCMSLCPSLFSFDLLFSTVSILRCCAVVAT